MLQGIAAGALLFSKADSGTMGLVMSYIVQASMSISGMVLLRTSMELEMVSVQRIFSLADITPEEKVDATSNSVSAAWPTRGKIVFRNFSASYHSDARGPQSLRHVNLDFTPGQSTAIVGRTGAGKSSLALSMLRVLHPSAGSIEIDGINIERVALHTLRSRVAMIPQNCRAFAGTIRENLDPEGSYDESELLRVISDSQLVGYFDSPEATLNFMVSKAGYVVPPFVLTTVFLAGFPSSGVPYQYPSTV